MTCQKAIDILKEHLNNISTKLANSEDKDTEYCKKQIEEIITSIQAKSSPYASYNGAQEKVPDRLAKLIRKKKYYVATVKQMLTQLTNWEKVMSASSSKHKKANTAEDNNAEGAGDSNVNTAEDSQACKKKPRLPLWAKEAIVGAFLGVLGLLLAIFCFPDYQNETLHAFECIKDCVGPIIGGVSATSAIGHISNKKEGAVIDRKQETIRGILLLILSLLILVISIIISFMSMRSSRGAMISNIIVGIIAIACAVYAFISIWYAGRIKVETKDNKIEEAEK